MGPGSSLPSYLAVTVACCCAALLLSLLMTQSGGSTLPGGRRGNPSAPSLGMLSKQQAVVNRSAATQLLEGPLQYLQRAALHQPENYSADCLEDHHSDDYIQGLRSSMQPVCWPRSGSHGAGAVQLSSKLLCSYRHTGAPEALCAGSQLALDLHALQAFFDADNGTGSLLSHRSPGLLVGDCQLQPNASAEAGSGVEGLPAQNALERFTLAAGSDWYKEGSFGLGGQDWLRRSFQPSSASTPPVCVAWVEHPLYFLGGRYDPVNVWHGLEDISHAFESYALMGWGADAQIVVLDSLDDDTLWAGFTYAPLWLKAFSPQHQPTTLRSLVRSAVQQAQEAHGGQLPEGAALCFREATWNVHGGVSLMSRGNNQANPCTNSSMVNTMVDFLLDRLGLAAARPASHANATPNDASWAALSNSSQPVYRLLAANLSVLLGGGRSPGSAPALAPAAGLLPPPPPALLARELWVPGLRVVWALRSSRARSQDRIVTLLRQHLGPQVEAIQFGDFGIEDQIRLMRRTDVLAGYHGAALTLSLFMPPESALVEVEEFYRCHCYRDAAAWRVRPYFIVSSRSPEAVVGSVMVALDLVSQRLLAVREGVPLSQAPNYPYGHEEDGDEEEQGKEGDYNNGFDPDLDGKEEQHPQGASGGSGSGSGSGTSGSGSGGSGAQPEVLQRQELTAAEVHGVSAVR